MASSVDGIEDNLQAMHVGMSRQHFTSRRGAGQLGYREILERGLHHPAKLVGVVKDQQIPAGRIESTSRELDAVFNRNGVTRVQSVGEALDPHRHQAMMEIPTDQAEAGTIVEEMQAGYMLKERLLRPALLGVAKKPD